MCVFAFVYLYLHVRQLGTLFLMSSYHFLSENIAYVGHICNFDQSSICVFVFACQTNRNFVFEVLVPLPFQKYFEYFWILWRKKLYSRICVFAFMYLHIRHSGTLFLRSSYHYLFKNITYVRHICNFDRNCICVFVYLYLCICTSDTWEHYFWGPGTITWS